MKKLTQFLHPVDDVTHDSKRIVIRTVDTNVLVIAVALILPLKRIDPYVKLWVAFGTGSHLRYFEIHVIAEKLGMEVSQAVSFFMHSRGVILSHRLQEKEKGRRGQNGWPTQRIQRHSWR